MDRLDILRQRAEADRRDFLAALEDVRGALTVSRIADDLVAGWSRESGLLTSVRRTAKRHAVAAGVAALGAVIAARFIGGRSRHVPAETRMRSKGENNGYRNKTENHRPVRSEDQAQGIATRHGGGKIRRPGRTPVEEQASL